MDHLVRNGAAFAGLQAMVGSRTLSGAASSEPNVPEPPTLDRLAGRSMANANQMAEVRERLDALLARLRGAVPTTAQGPSAAPLRCQGVLGGIEEALNQQDDLLEDIRERLADLARHV